jgi:hypothetical protein
MGVTTQAVEVDGDRLMHCVFRAVDEVGAGASIINTELRESGLGGRSWD